MEREREREFLEPHQINLDLRGRVLNTEFVNVCVRVYVCVCLLETDLILNS